MCVQALLAVASGAVLVSPEWLRASLAASRWLPEEDHAAQVSWNIQKLLEFIPCLDLFNCSTCSYMGLSGMALRPLDNRNEHAKVMPPCFSSSAPSYTHHASYTHDVKYAHHARYTHHASSCCCWSQSEGGQLWLSISRL